MENWGFLDESSPEFIAAALVCGALMAGSIEFAFDHAERWEKNGTRSWPLTTVLVVAGLTLAISLVMLAENLEDDVHAANQSAGAIELLLVLFSSLISYRAFISQCLSSNQANPGESKTTALGLWSVNVLLGLAGAVLGTLYLMDEVEGLLGTHDLATAAWCGFSTMTAAVGAYRLKQTA